MMKFAYVILHYKNINDTMDCINSIKGINGKSIIIVVDNATLDNVDSRKLEPFVNDLVKLDSNLGFAKANNIGCKLAIEKYNPDYLVVLNNDIVIEQMSFEKSIISLDEKYKFDVLGPKINTYGGNSVNPFKTYDTVEEINEQINNAKKFIKIYESYLLYSLYSFYRKIKCFVSMKSEYKNGNEDMTDVSLHGCALIFSEKYYKKYDTIFYNETFLFHEEEFLSLRRRKDKLCFLYSPDIEVFHKEGASVALEYKKEKQQVLFKNKERIKSLEMLLNETNDNKIKEEK